MDEKKENSLRIPSIHILVHGVNSQGSWYPDFLQHASTLSPPPLVIPFTWGDYTTGKEGGSLIRAVDEVHQMFENPLLGYDRLYQGHSVVRLKRLIDACERLSCQINVIAHSNGTLVTVGALLLGAHIDFFLMMGSPLDCDNERSQKELLVASKNVRKTIYNLWSHKDAWATMKGGIGAFGDNPVYLERNPGIINIPFVHGFTYRGHRMVSHFPRTEKVSLLERAGERAELHHTDYYQPVNMPLFVEFMKEFDAQAGAPVVLEESRLQELSALADWTQTPYYKSHKNVSLQDPDLEQYKEAIQQVLAGFPEPPELRKAG